MVNDVKQPLSVYAVSHIGYSHLQSGKPCQDHADLWQTDDRTGITACDGHGGDLYIRSHLGSRFASEAFRQVFGALDEQTPASPDQLKLALLCAWNAAVERDLSAHPFEEAELAPLDDESRFLLEQNPFLAYGTTLHGVLAWEGHLLCAGIGDGGIFALRGETVTPLMQDEDEETVANLTHSLCEERAGRYLAVDAFDFSEYDGVLVCTDGVLNPYLNLDNFARSFVLPVVAEARRGNFAGIGAFMTRLGEEIGIGDDVSLALMLKPAAPAEEGKQENENRG